MNNNIRGMTLLGVLASLGALGVVVYALMTVFTNSLLQQKYVEQRYSVMNLHREIYEQLTNSKSCEATFQAPGQVLNRDDIDNPPLEEFSSVTTIKSPDGLTDVYKKFVAVGDPTYENNTIRIDGFKIKGYQDQGLDGVGRMTATAILEILYKQNVRTIGSEIFRPKQIKIKFTFKKVPGLDLGTDKDVKTCSAIGGTGDSFWTLTGLGDGIFYKDGSVGIGTATPIAPLHVESSTTMQVARFEGSHLDSTNAWITNSAPGGRAYVIGSTGNASPMGGGRFSISDATAGGTTRIAIDSTGKVGIGTTSPQRNLHIASVADTAIRIDSPVANQNFVEFSKSGVQAGFIGMAIDTGLFSGINSGDMAIRSQKTPLHLGAQASPAITILTNGRVGIGTTAPRTELDINAGTISGGFPGTHGGTTAPVCYDGSTGVMDACVSLRKYKKNIQPLELGLNEILQLKPVSYELKSSGEKEIGFIAEEATEIDLRFGQKSSLGKIVGVKYSQMVALLTKGIQELHFIDAVVAKRVEELETETKILRSEVKALKGYICAKDHNANMCVDHL